MTRLSNKRRKVHRMAQQQALQHYTDLKNATTTNACSTQRSHLLILTTTATTRAKATERTDMENIQVNTVNESTATSDRPATLESSTVEQSPINPTTATVMDLTQYDNRYYQQRADNIEVAMVRIEAAKQGVQKEQVALWGVYTYGLQHVMGLTDLASSPDAILPGNFSKPTNTDAATR
jgi:hypothetical protein